METTRTLTQSQLTLLAEIASRPGPSSSQDMHPGTRMALVNRGLIRMVDRFASGVTLYTVTTAGMLALPADEEPTPEPCAHRSELRRGSTIYPDGNTAHPVTAWWCHGCGEELERVREYDAELAERAAIQADAENERDGYRG